MNRVDVVINNIRNEMKRRGIKQHEFAANMGYGSVHMSNILRRAKGGADSISFLERAAEILDVSITDLLAVNDTASQFTYMYDLAGNLTNTAFKTDWLKQFGTDVLFVEPMPDESMMPTIKAGDMLLVAKRASIARDGIYMFKFAENISVRRATLQPNQQITIHSESNLVTTVTIQKSEISATLLGQVVWLGRNT